MLIGNEKDGWTYYAKNGDNTGSYKNERGDEQENNSFTIARFKSLGDFANSKHNTFKDNYDDVNYGQEPFANSERDSKGAPKQRYEKASFFVTTKKEDNVMKETASKTTATVYKMFLNNCIDKKTAEIVGRRKKGSLVILTIKAKEAFSSNIKFYKEENDIWLSYQIPSIYITD